MLGSMLPRSSSSAKQALLRRGYDPKRKVAIFGAAGGIGQPLGLLMKLKPLVSNHSLYDIANTPGVAADGGHNNTRSEAVVKKSSGVATLATSHAGKSNVPLAAFNTGLCVARSVAASLTCGRHFTTKSENPESADATDGESVRSSNTNPKSAGATDEASVTSSDSNPESTEATHVAVASFECGIQPPHSEELEFVLKFSWPSNEQDFERSLPILHETAEKIIAAVMDTSEEDKPVGDRK